jgi:phage terminase small subunit
MPPKLRRKARKSPEIVLRKVGRNHYFGGFSMSRKKTDQQRARDGDTRKIGRKKLAASLAKAPKVQAGLECPGHLQGDAADLFQFFAEQLELSGLDARPDSQALAIASEALATAWKAARQLKRQGEVRSVPVLAGVGRNRRVVGSKQYRNRWFSVKIESQKLFDRIAGKFGLVGPQSRSGLEVPFTPAKREHGMSPQLFEMLNRPRKPRVPTPEEIAYRAANPDPPKEPVQ